jgi:tRNA A58 N-methylase Trm61
VVKDVKDYRRIAKELVCEKDKVLELGCGSGKTTLLLSKISAKVLALDRSPKEYLRAKERLKKCLNVYVENVDAWNITEVRKLVLKNLDGEVDVLMVDLGGAEDPGKILSLTWRYLKVFKPKLVMIKNRLLSKFLEQSQTLNNSFGMMNTPEKD